MFSISLQIEHKNICGIIFFTSLLFRLLLNQSKPLLITIAPLIVAMEFDDEILAGGPTSSIGGGFGDSSFADFSMTHSPVPLCHSTPIKRSSSLGSVPGSGESCNLNDSILIVSSDENNADNVFEQRQPARDGSASLPFIPVLPPDLRMSRMIQNGQGIGNAPAAGSRRISAEPRNSFVGSHRYWLRERKSSFRAFGDIDGRYGSVKTITKKRGRNRRHRRQLRRRRMKYSSDPSSQDESGNTSSDPNSDHDMDMDEPPPFQMAIAI
uniref:CCT domain-containing protein n=1 Tax=Setaria digitata TaxID=48799 RepID=A0A915PPW0_9BILA